MTGMIGQIFPYAETTGGITVRVAPHYLPDQSDPERGYYVWAYHVRVENAGLVPVRLMARRWLSWLRRWNSALNASSTCRSKSSRR